jgi:hypothetical protein
MGKRAREVLNESIESIHIDEVDDDVNLGIFYGL